MMRTRVLCLLGTVLAVNLAMTSTSRADEMVLDSRMYHDPELPTAKIVWVYPDNLLRLWLVALERPEADYQSRGALAIVRAHKEGLKGLQAAVDPLLAVLERLDQTDRPNGDASSSPGDEGTGSSPKTMVRLAVARALIELDARKAAPQLFQLTQSEDSHLRDLIEPALTRWEFRPAGSVWLARIRRPEANAADLRRAVRGLAALRMPEAGLPLKDLVHSEQTAWPIRLEAARALGITQTSGLEQDARQLVGVNIEDRGSKIEDRKRQRGLTAAKGPASTQYPSSSLCPRLAAGWLLRHHQGDQAVQLLQILAGDSEPAVARVALDRLLEIDSKLILPVIESTLASPDAKVRLLGVETLYRNPTVERIRLLAEKLDEEHPDVRAQARHMLYGLATKGGLRDAVIKEGSRVLAGQSWRGLEQATMLLVLLDHKPAAERLVQLLTFERPEVLVAAGWGLRRLDVPETLPAALSYLKSIHGQPVGQESLSKPDWPPVLAWDQQLSHLAQFMGQRRYQPAEEELRTFVPRTPKAQIGMESRAASIWALGFIFQGNPEPGLTRQLEERLNDGPKGKDPGEDPRVRRMSAISLGRMRSKNSLETFRKYQPAKPTSDPICLACGWAILQITGEPVPPPLNVELPAGIFKNWLQPIQETKPK
jgi:HEAT repeat protein